MYAEGRAPKPSQPRSTRGVPSPGATWSLSRAVSDWLCSAISGDPGGELAFSITIAIVVSLSGIDHGGFGPLQTQPNRRSVANPRVNGSNIADESLRIVSEELWQRVKARQRQRAHNIGIRVKAGLSRSGGNRPRATSSVLWMADLHECGARFTMGTTARMVRDVCKRERLQQWPPCSPRSRRKPAPRRYSTIRWSRDEILDEIERRVREALAADRSVKPDLERIAHLKEQLENLVCAVADRRACAPRPPLVANSLRLRSELERLEAVRRPPAIVPLVTDVRERIKVAVNELARLLEKDPERARAALRDAGLGPQITLRPAANGAYLNAEIALEIVPLAAIFEWPVGINGSGGRI